MNIVLEIKVDPEFLEEAKRWGQFLTAYMENSTDNSRDTKREGKEVPKGNGNMKENDKATESISKPASGENVGNIERIKDDELQEREAETILQHETYTLEEIRAKLTELSRAGKREAVNILITSYGVKRLTDLPAEEYADIMQKAGEL